MQREGESEGQCLPQTRAYREAIYEGTDTVRQTSAAGGSTHEKVRDPAYWDMTAQLGGLDTIKSRKAKMERGELLDATGNREPPSKAAKGDGKRFPTQCRPASSSSGSGEWQSGWGQQTWKEKTKEDRDQDDRKWKDQKRK
jgi:hypothetical protein